MGNAGGGGKGAFFSIGIAQKLFSKVLGKAAAGLYFLDTMKTVFALLAVLFALKAPGQKVFNVRDYGANGDGQSLDTVAIQKALDDCDKAGGGTVWFPAGIYLSRPITLRGRKLTLEIDTGARLQATTNYADFMKAPGVWFTGQSNDDFIPFILGTNSTEVTITGGGTIDGNGAVWWGEAEKARQRVPGYPLPRPNLVRFVDCKQLCVENIRLQNSPRGNLETIDCDGVVCSNVTIVNPAHSANTDGINPIDSANVLITKCSFDTGDDDVAIKAQRKVKGRKFACENIMVTDCTFLHGHGMSVGSETRGGVRNVVVKNCTFADTENGLRLKSARGKGGLVENVLFEDITMTNVDPAITFSCYYTFNSAQDPVQKAIPEDDTVQPINDQTPIFRDVRVKNVTATCQRNAGMIVGLPEKFFSDVVFENVHISAVTGMKIESAAGIRFKNSQVMVKEGKPFIVKNAQVSGIE
jgi:polygalacturonase